MNISQYGASFYEPWRAQYRDATCRPGSVWMSLLQGPGPKLLTVDMAMGQYLIPFLGKWTSINPSYFDVNYRGTGFWPIPIWLKIKDIHRPQMARFDAEVVRIEAVKAATSRNQTWQWKNHPAIISHIDFIEDARMPNNGSWRHVWLLEGNQPWHLK